MHCMICTGLLLARGFRRGPAPTAIAAASASITFRPSLRSQAARESSRESRSASIAGRSPADGPRELEVRVPRVQLLDCSVRQANPPWAGKLPGFTLLFEAFVLARLHSLEPELSIAREYPRPRRVARNPRENSNARHGRKPPFARADSCYQPLGLPPVLQRGLSAARQRLHAANC